jgi:hypothetical protein
MEVSGLRNDESRGFCIAALLLLLPRGTVVWTRVIRLGGNKEYILSNLVGNRLCGLVVRVPGYRSRGPGSISGAVTFSEK